MANENLSRYQYDPGLLTQFTQNARPALLDFIKQQNRYGGSSERSVNSMVDRVSSQDLKAYALPENQYNNMRGESNLSSGGFHKGDEIFLKGKYGDRGIGHELGHELYGHAEDSESVPKMNWYNKADRLLKGWLPSFSKYAERPSYTSISNTKRRRAGYDKFENRGNYNQRMRTGEYNPKFADAPFDYLQKSMWDMQDKETTDAMLSNVLSTVKTKGGDYGKYDKRSLKAKDFRYAFKEARASGNNQFEWDGRKYSTELA
tara:strand:- start:8789 stop:9568 length:780 start_codon:yes stop_codon:yes gene_type:complete